MDLSKFNPQNHLYKINNGDLYRILTILEDHGILYTIDDNNGDSIILECKDYFYVFNHLKNFIDETKNIIRIYRNRTYEELNPIPILDHNNFMKVEDNISINPINGSWMYNGRFGTFNEGISLFSKYLDRINHYELFYWLKTILDFGTLSFTELINKSYNIVELSNIYFSRVRAEVLETNLEERPKNRYIFSRSTNGLCYWWVTSYKFNLIKDISFINKKSPILMDVETWDYPLEKFLPNYTSAYRFKVPGIDNIELEYSHSLLQLKRISDSKILNPSDYETYDEILKKRIKSIFRILKDRGYISGHWSEDIIYSINDWNSVGVL